AAAAQADRIVDCKVSVTDDALVVDNVAEGNRLVPCYWLPGASGKYEPPPAFQAEDDWLASLTLTFRNRTNQTIVYASIGLGFPQAQPERIVPVSLGRIPANAAFDNRGRPLQQGGRTPLALGPGQTLVVRVGDYTREIKGTLEPVPAGPVTNLVVHLTRCYFADGMRWSPGTYALPDPGNPGQWKAMQPRSYFPGDRHGQ
ncbi:MAG: hypothetical protein KGN36_05790, partial [Acidobacteriota bacterium]|nr:hypothetical protein [Acidobacteriota bacterium]